MDIKRSVIVAGCGAVVFGCGAGVGHILTKISLTKQFEEERRKENLALKEYYSKLYKKDAYSTPEAVLDQTGGQEVHDKGLLDNAVDALLEYQGEKDEGLPKRTRTEPDPEENDEETERDGTVRVRDGKGRFAPKGEVQPNGRLVEPNKGDLEDILTKLREEGGLKEPVKSDKPIQYNTFSNPQPASTDAPLEEQGGGDEEEIDNSKPYLLKEDEFIENEVGFTQTQLTYFIEDGVLADDSDMALEQDEIDTKVGRQNLEAFGYIEDQPHVVLVRNETLEADYEIARSEGAFGEEVGGFIREESSSEG